MVPARIPRATPGGERGSRHRDREGPQAARVRPAGVGSPRSPSAPTRPGPRGGARPGFFGTRLRSLVISRTRRASQRKRHHRQAGSPGLGEV